ncbi:MAG TPA: HAMP domain-containing sensor histidine kinase [Mycobacteriales bacterium]|nr:HAMP domain-containing sensor histidine kinase [Mycobacteriales bacterium]
MIGVRRGGLRSRVALAFGLGALLVSATFAASTYEIARGYLLSQREATVRHHVFADARLVAARLSTTGTRVSDVLVSIDPSAGGALVVHRGDRWFSSSLDVGRDKVPGMLQHDVETGSPSIIRVRVNGEPSVVMGLPLPAPPPTARAYLYEVVSLSELQGTLRVLSTVLAFGAVLTALGGAGLGWWASARVVRPLNHVAGAAAQIAGGQLNTRLAPTTDRDLATIVGSFNSMVDSLQQRIERDTRFVGDVSHELRSPLTTLVASVDVLSGRAEELPPRARTALGLVTAELARFRRLLDNLLELARADAGLDSGSGEPVSLHDLLAHTLTGSGRPVSLLDGDREPVVRGDKSRLERAFVNLLDNADRHGGGVRGVTVRQNGDEALVLVDDTGPGVPAADRERIFERFATGRTARGSSSGTGLGLALVAETIGAHGGAVWCTDRAGGGARFVVSLPREES